MFGFAAGYLPALALLVKVQSAKPFALAGETSEVITVVLQTEGPVASSEGTVLAASEENVVGEKVSTPTPSPEPTIEPTETPEPTPVPTETPTPVPTATPDVWSPPEYEPWFAQYAGQYGVDKNELERISQCESQNKPDIVSRNGLYVGLFQFSASTWESYRKLMGLDPNPGLRTNPEESIKTAAYVIQQTKGTSPWPVCLR